MTNPTHDCERFHVSAAAPTDPGRVLKHNDTFAVLSRAGEIDTRIGSNQGLYHGGTRFASRLRWRLEGHPLLLLSSSLLQSNVVLQVDQTNSDFHDARGALLVPYGTVHLSSSIFLREESWFQRLVVWNYGNAAIALALQVEFDSDFVDVFEVRGTHRDRRGLGLPPEIDSEAAILGYRGLDQLERRTRYGFSPPPSFLDEHGATFQLNLGVRQARELYVWVTCLLERKHHHVVAFESTLAETVTSVQNLVGEHCQVQSSNEQFNEWVSRSQSDLRMLITETPQGPYPYAGVPWFSTPFGRDAIWTALQMLWVSPDIAAGVLRFLSATQSEGFDAELDAEPGKILHEIRAGEMATLREIPFGRYYGSIDSTPLYLILAARYYEATADRVLIESIWKNLVEAMHWLDHHGDPDRDGFVEYGRRSKDGLIQQGWKDSSNSVFHRDGTPAVGPIALCEVQAYAYEARQGMALLSRALGKTEWAKQLETEAAGLRTRFDQAFWCEELSIYALALDAKKQPCRVRTSNAGHCLFSGIALPARAERMAHELFSDRMHTGWGIRTLASDEQSYNPMSYHNGSIWPHDNAIIASGLARYGFKREAARILSGMFEASLFADLHRLPELFCGFSREPGQAPTVYPVACSPQAWASGAVFMMLKAMLGMKVSATESRLSFHHPVLPPFLEHLELRNLRVGSARVDLGVHRYSDDVVISVTRKLGNVEIIMVK